MKPMKIFYYLIYILFMVSLLLFNCKKKDTVEISDAEAEDLGRLTQDKKVALVQSYWTNYQWGIDIEKGFLEGMNISPDVLYKEPANEEGLGIKRDITLKVDDANVDVLIICMDTKRRSDEAWKVESAELSIKKLDAFKPDVVILADDNAQKYLGKKIVNKYPIVFNGVNSEYTEYYSKTDQVTGLHERMNFAETSKLFLTIFPNVKTMIMLTDFTETSKPVVDQFKNADLTFSKTEAFSFEQFGDYKAKVTSLQGQKDTGIAIFNLNFKDSTQEQAIAWTLQNSKLPEMTFQSNTVMGGLLLTSAVSGTAHGKEAARIAISILKGKKANDIPVSIPTKGDVIVNQARADMLNIKIPAEILNAASIYKELDTLKK